MSIFSKVATRSQGYNAFNLSHERKQTMTMGPITPFFLQEVIPGDRFRVNSETFLRMAPTLAPIMHRVNVTVHYFYAPNRILWDNWKDFITGGEDGTAAPSFPTIRFNTAGDVWVTKKTLFDYLGLPAVDAIPDTMEISVNALPFRMYQKIYNEYYRNQNLQTKVEEYSGDGEMFPNSSICSLRNRNWEKDYFTSCLPYAQKGNPVTAPIEFEYISPNTVTDGVGNPITEAGNIIVNAAGVLQESPDAGGTDGAAIIENIDPESTGIDIEELRQAVRLQEWLETNARAGSRYVESIQAHFGERVPDYTAQRPIFLGGGKVPVNISEVLSTYSGQNANTHDYPQGHMSGHGVSVGNTNAFKAKFTEHGFVMGLIQVQPRTAYQQGRERMWNKTDKFDYFWREFAQLGEQEVPVGEVYYDYVNGSNGELFGYQSRYAEYKFRQSQVAGDFRDNLSFWHMGRIFQDRPVLNDSFITADPRKDIYAVNDPDENELWVQIFNNVKALRKMPYHNVPTL